MFYEVIRNINKIVEFHTNTLDFKQLMLENQKKSFHFIFLNHFVFIVKRKFEMNFHNFAVTQKLFLHKIEHYKTCNQGV